MRKIALAALLAAASVPAAAQHAGHPGHQAPPTDPHAGHAEPPVADAPASSADPHAHHAPPADPDPHAGHGPGTAHERHSAPRPQGAAGPHAGHGATPLGLPPVAPPPAAAFEGPEHAADLVHDPAAMAAAREALRTSHGEMRNWRFSIDQLEIAWREGRDGYVWEDVQFWHGGDIDRLWIKSQGEGTFGEGIERVEAQALWSHALDPWFNLQAGLRQDVGPGPDRTHLALGVQGLAPYWFEVDAAAFLSHEGEVTARIEAEYDQRITQRLILQPRVEAELSLQEVPELGLGAGLTSAEAGLRLRYEIVPEFAPYLGVVYERAFGRTADFRRAEGEQAGGWSFVAGIRAWF